MMLAVTNQQLLAIILYYMPNTPANVINRLWPSWKVSSALLPIHCLVGDVRGERASGMGSLMISIEAH
eukprot:9321245-Karenia_brevis.AAC.1